MKVGDPMLAMRQNTTNAILSFNMIKLGMELKCTYKINSKRDGNNGKFLSFSGTVIQKTKHLVFVRDSVTNRVHSISLLDCICGYGKFKIRNT